MFVAPLTGPYMEYHEMPVYIDGFAYSGMFNIQEPEKRWPATAGLANEEKDLF